MIVSKIPSFHRLLAWPISTRNCAVPSSAQACRSRNTALLDVGVPPPKSPSMRTSRVPQPVSVRLSMPIRLKRAVMPKSPPCMSAALLFSGMVCAVGASVWLRPLRSVHAESFANP